MIKLKNHLKTISYLEFKLNKELAHQDTFGKDDIIRNEYQQYVDNMPELKEEHFEVIDRNRAREHERMKKQDK